MIFTLYLIWLTSYQCPSPMLERDQFCFLSINFWFFVSFLLRLTFCLTKSNLIPHKWSLWPTPFLSFFLDPLFLLQYFSDFKAIQMNRSCLLQYSLGISCDSKLYREALVKMVDHGSHMSHEPTYSRWLSSSARASNPFDL